MHAHLHIHPLFVWKPCCDCILLCCRPDIIIQLLAHTMASLCIWIHFGLIKWQQKEKEKGDASSSSSPPSFAGWKQVVATIEFGAMHVILFQMALLPLTMSRYCIAALGSNSAWLNRIVPMNRMLYMHIHLGSCMIVLVFLATALYLSFFSILCLAYDEQEYCTKLTSEIMCSGYAILACLGLVAATSYWRHVIPYEIFHGAFCRCPSRLVQCRLGLTN